MRKLNPNQFKALVVEHPAPFNCSHSWLVIVPSYWLTLLPTSGLCTFTSCHVPGNASSMWKAKKPCSHRWLPTIWLPNGLAILCTLVKRNQQFLPTKLFFPSAMRMSRKWLILQCVYKMRRHTEKRHSSQLVVTHVQDEWALGVTRYHSFLQSGQNTRNGCSHVLCFVQ